MKWYQLAGDWEQFTAMVKGNWSMLTDDDLTTFGGKSEQLAGILQHRYGYPKEQAEQEIKAFASVVRQ